MTFGIRLSSGLLSFSKTSFVVIGGLLRTFRTETSHTNRHFIFILPPPERVYPPPPERIVRVDIFPGRVISFLGRYSSYVTACNVRNTPSRRGQTFTTNDRPIGQTNGRPAMTPTATPASTLSGDRGELRRPTPVRRVSAAVASSEFSGAFRQPWHTHTHTARARLPRL